MITKLLNEVNEKIEKLNNLVQDKEYFKKLEERIEKVNNYAQEQKQKIERLNNIRNKAIEYINEYAWQEDIIGDMWTTTGEPVKDRYMRLEWDNCNELLEILKGEDKE